MLNLSSILIVVLLIKQREEEGRAHKITHRQCIGDKMCSFNGVIRKVILDFKNHQRICFIKLLLVHSK